MLKKDTHAMQKHGLNYLVGFDSKPRRFKPWLGDSLSFLYDLIMKRSIFPRKLAADITKHHDILRKELKDVHGRSVLELATGTGSATLFLENDNFYIGTDISPGLLKRAARKCHAAGFEQAELYVTSADDLPFDESVFDLCLCILSLNFFDDLNQVVQEVYRVLIPGSFFLCVVPVPERNIRGSRIRGMMRSEGELREVFHDQGFVFERLSDDNGALLYFKAVKA